MLERLLEHWLDSVNERTYQSAFCQLLAAQGYKILHSTRHMPLEFGKEVIALGHDGIPCAYQLKGNPGGRLTLAQYREIAPQLNELVTQAIVYPGIPNLPHRSYLVTNGLVEEEVQRAIDDYNRRLLQLSIPEDQHLRIISRGDLLAQLIQYGSAIWPVEISPLNSLLELLVCEGREIFPNREAARNSKRSFGAGVKADSEVSRGPQTKGIQRRDYDGYFTHQLR